MLNKKNSIICSACGQKCISKARFCHRCGTEINENNPINSVQGLSADIMEINKNKKRRGFWGRQINKISYWLKGSCSLDAVDNKIVGLVNNYSLPEKLDDIYDFMLLCESNISYCRGRKLLENTAEEYINKIVHNVWMNKFNQAYRKANEMQQGEKTYLLLEQLYNRIHSEDFQYKAATLKTPSIAFLVIVVIAVIGYFVLATAQIMELIG